MAKKPKAASKKAPSKKAPSKKAPSKKAPKVKVTSAGYLADLLALRKPGDPPDFAPLEQLAFTQVAERIPTGSIALDKLTGGGWPVGRITEVCAWEGVGKSTILDQSAAQCQRMGGIVVLIDSERARDLKYTRQLGVDTSSLIISEADTMEDSFVQLDKVISVQEKKRTALKGKVPPILVLWDSLGGTPARAELAGKPDDTHIAAGARVVNLNFKRIVGPLIENRIALVFANHFYKTIGGFSTLVAYGGKGVRYYPSIRLWLSRKSGLDLGSGEKKRSVGHVIEAKLRKTKVGQPRPPEAIGLIHGAGVNNAYTLFEWGKVHGIGGEYPKHRWITRSGSYYYLVPPGRDSIAIHQQFEGLGALLTEHPDIYQEFAAAYLAAE